LPVYRETLDDPLGLVHVKDIFALLEPMPDGSLNCPNVPIAKFKRDVLFVPPSMPARELLLKMQTTHIHLALVIDEYGGTDGLVSIEDLIEEIVGDIDDEHDVEEAPQLKGREDGGFDADARLDLEDFKAQTGIDLAPNEGEEEIDTLGGLAASLVGRVPQRGEIIPHPSGFEFEVIEADPRRVKKLRLRRAPPKPAFADGSDNGHDARKG
jgi:CBS domain containing-hemolysin-like protein